METRLFVPGFARAVTRPQAFRGLLRVFFPAKPSATCVATIFSFALAGAGPSAEAQLVSYSFGSAGAPRTQATTSATELSASSFSGNIGAPNTGSGAPVFSGGSGGSFFTASGWTASLPSANYFQFTLTPDDGFALTATGISFGYRATASGPTSFALRSSADSFVSSLAVASLSNDSLWHATGSLSFTLDPTTDATTFRLYAFGASASGGTLRMDDVSMSGSMSAIPEPSTYAAVLGAVALGLCVARRRRAARN